MTLHLSPGSQAAQKAHPNQTAVKSSAVLGIMLLLAGITLGGLTFPNTEFLKSNATKNASADGMYVDQHDHYPVGSEPGFEVGVNPGVASGTCSHHVYIPGFISSTIVNSIIVVLVLYAFYACARGKVHLLAGEEAPLVVNQI